MIKAEIINQIKNITAELTEYNLHELYDICHSKELYLGQEAGFRALCKKYDIPIKKKLSSVNTTIIEENIEEMEEVEELDTNPILELDMICDSCKQKKRVIYSKRTRDKTKWLWKYCDQCYLTISRNHQLPIETDENEKTI